jgi:hypothetical protein
MGEEETAVAKNEIDEKMWLEMWKEIIKII